MRYTVRFVSMGWLACLGCASTPTYPLRPPRAQPAPVQGVAYEWRTMMANDGTELFSQCWKPSAEPARGLVVVIHGIKDHSSRYAELALHVVRATKLAVCAMDHRGHGRSAGARAGVSSFDTYLDDLEVFIAKSRRSTASDAPLFLFGHSMGGALATLLVTERHVATAGIVLSAPALRVDRLPLEIASAGVLATLIPDAPIVSADNQLFSRDPHTVQDIQQDELIYAADHPAKFGAAFIDGISRVWAKADFLPCPLLALHGTGDKLTDPRGSAELVRRSANRDATLRLYPKLYHDLVHEPERDRVMGDVVAWLLAHSTQKTKPTSASTPGYKHP